MQHAQPGNYSGLGIKIRYCYSVVVQGICGHFLTLFVLMVTQNAPLKSTAEPLDIINSEGIVYHRHEVLHIIKPQEMHAARDDIRLRR